MTTRQKYAVIAPAPGSACPSAAYATAIAQALSGSGELVYVHDDLSRAETHEGAIHYIRASDFEQNFSDYRDHRRIYCLGNHFTSLFAVDLLRAYPGVVVTAEGSYHDLIRAMFMKQRGWPENYALWLATTLGENGKTIARTIMQHRRLPEAIGPEVTDRTPLSLEGNPCIVFDDNTLFPIVRNFRQQKITTETDIDASIVCVGIPNETIEAINTDLKNLGRTEQITPKSASDTDIADEIASAGIVVLAGTGAPSPALSTCLSLGKAMIVAGHSWNNVLTGSCCLHTDNPAARHQIIAAIAAITANDTLKAKLQKAALELWTTNTHRVTIGDIISQTHTQPTIEALTPAESDISRETNQPNQTPSLKLEGESACISAALIGSVPAPAFLKTILPGIDPSFSPRFATPDLAKALTAKLSDHGPSDTSSLLAHLGFETPVVQPDHAANNVNYDDINHVQSWSVIKQGLRNPDRAVTFNVHIDGLPSINGTDSSVLKDHYGTEINFADSLANWITKKTIPLFDHVTGYLEDSGLFWKLDKAQHTLTCIIIVGIRGVYNFRCNESQPDHKFMVADSTSTQCLGNKGISLMADANGILSFKICGVTQDSPERLDSMELLKSLAETTMILEWSSHDR